MREVHGYHGEHRRHARDAHTPVDNPAIRPHDVPKHTAHDSLKLKMLDPAVRVAEQLRYRKLVDEAYKPRHAVEQSKPWEAKPEHAPPETRDKPAAGIAKRRLEESTQAPDVAAREKPRFTDKAVTFWSAASGWAITTAADHLHVIPPGLAGEISGAIGVVALGILWRQSERRENKDGNRPKD